MLTCNKIQYSKQNHKSKHFPLHRRLPILYDAQFSTRAPLDLGIPWRGGQILLVRRPETQKNFSGIYIYSEYTSRSSFDFSPFTFASWSDNAVLKWQSLSFNAATNVCEGLHYHARTRKRTNARTHKRTHAQTLAGVVMHFISRAAHETGGGPSSEQRYCDTHSC